MIDSSYAKANPISSKYTGVSMDERLDIPWYKRRVRIFLALLFVLTVSGFFLVKSEVLRVPNVPASSVKVSLVKETSIGLKTIVSATVDAQTETIISTGVGGLVSQVDYFEEERITSGSRIALLESSEVSIENLRAITAVRDAKLKRSQAETRLENLLFSRKKQELEARAMLSELKRDLSTKSALADEGFYPRQSLIQIREKIEYQENVAQIESEDFDRKILSLKSELISTAGDLQSAEEGLIISENLKKELEVTSTLDGVITELHVKLGNYVSKGSPIATVVDASDRIIIGVVDQAFFERFEVGQVARVRGNEVGINLILVKKSPNIDDGKFEAQYILDGGGPVQLPLGKALTLDHFYGEVKALTIPNDGLLDSGFGDSLFIEAASGVFERQTVEFGYSDSEVIEIRTGVVIGDKVLSSGSNEFSVRKKIRVVQ